jgi:hypothetical protein
MSADIFPKSKPVLRGWLETFETALDDHGAEVGIDAPRVTLIKGHIDGWIASFVAIEPAKNAWQTTTAANDGLTLTLIPELRTLIKDIKGSTAYTHALGEAFGIIAPVSGFDPSTFKTTLKIKIEGGRIIIEFVKSEVEGVHIYTRLRGELGWTYLATDTHSPYYDTRPLATPGHAETREYMARGVINDEEIGLDSDIASVVFSG